MLTFTHYYNVELVFTHPLHSPIPRRLVRESEGLIQEKPPTAVGGFRVTIQDMGTYPKHKWGAL